MHKDEALHDRASGLVRHLWLRADAASRGYYFVRALPRMVAASRGCALVQLRQSLARPHPRVTAIEGATVASCDQAGEKRTREKGEVSGL